MPSPIRFPRINNNDDLVRVSVLSVTTGAFVRAGETVFEVESDKAVVAVEAERNGHVLAVLAREGEMAPVGSIALWLGDSPDEAVPEGPEGARPDTAAPGLPTAKARLLLQRHGLAAADVPHQGERLTASDVEAHVASHGLAPVAGAGQAVAPTTPTLPAPAAIRPAAPARRGMIASVAWQRDHAAATYLEIPYDPAPWERYAAEFAAAHRLLFSPLLALMAHRLVVLAREMPMANATVVDGVDGPNEVLYESVNLGFTVQAGDTLYLAVLSGAEGLDEAGFVAQLSALQRRAMARKLEPAELRGATIGFSSMARWGVSRHVPVLAPWTSLMLAHTVSGPAASPAGVLGATYDHRMLSGFDTVRLLRALATPPSPQG
jgi:pyruvate dehydrogenase E2 component (dihydrolipoamide acetyltransferase)